MKVSIAKQKICPFMSKIGVFEGTQELWELTCICGDCMSWVYHQTHEQIENKSSGDDKVCMASHTDGKELDENDKIGICAMIRR